MIFDYRILSLSLFFLIACSTETLDEDQTNSEIQEDSDYGDYATVISDHAKMDSLKTEVVKSGDSDAYNELLYLDSEGISENLFAYHLILAYEYNSSAGYSNAFHSLFVPFSNAGIGYKDIAPPIQKIMYQLLVDGAKNGNDESQACLDEIDETGNLE